MYFFCLKPQLTRKSHKATKCEQEDLKGTPEESKVNKKAISNGFGLRDQENKSLSGNNCQSWDKFFVVSAMPD